MVVKKGLTKAQRERLIQEFNDYIDSIEYMYHNGQPRIKRDNDMLLIWLSGKNMLDLEVSTSKNYDDEFWEMVKDEQMFKYKPSIDLCDRIEDYIEDIDNSLDIKEINDNIKCIYQLVKQYLEGGDK